MTGEEKYRPEFPVFPGQFGSLRGLAFSALALLKPELHRAQGMLADPREEFDRELLAGPGILRETLLVHPRDRFRQTEQKELTQVVEADFPAGRTEQDQQGGER